MVSSLEKTAGTIPSEPPPSRYLQWDRYCERILVFLALAILTPPPQARQAERARTQFDCTTTKVIMTWVMFILGCGLSIKLASISGLRSFLLAIWSNGWRI
jgi:hypothetical protein